MDPSAGIDVDELRAFFHELASTLERWSGDDRVYSDMAEGLEIWAGKLRMLEHDFRKSCGYGRTVLVSIDVMDFVLRQEGPRTGSPVLTDANGRLFPVPPAKA